MAVNGHSTQFGFESGFRTLRLIASWLTALLGKQRMITVL